MKPKRAVSYIDTKDEWTRETEASGVLPKRKDVFSIETENRYVLLKHNRYWKCNRLGFVLYKKTIRYMKPMDLLSY